MNKSFKYFIALFICYGSFQYGRIHDEGIEVYQPEYNHVVLKDRCDIIQDTVGNVNFIWYKEKLYVLDESLNQNF